MSESSNNGPTSARMDPPFPSRRDLHRTRIPQSPQGNPPIVTPEPISTPALPAQPVQPIITRRPVVDAPLEPETIQLPVVTEIPVPEPVPARLSWGRVDPTGSSSAVTPLVQPEDNQVTETTSFRTRRLEEQRNSARKRKRRRNWRAGIVILVILAIIGGAGWWAVTTLGDGNPLGKSAAEDYPGPGSASVDVIVDPDDFGIDIGQKLFDAGVVKSVAAFTAAFEGNSASVSIKPGTYTLKTEMSAAGALSMLLNEANRTENTATVIPGQAVVQIVEKLKETAGFTTEQIDEAMADTAALGLPAEAGGKLEGWLWAGSYEISSVDTPQTILTAMIAKTVVFLESTGTPRADWETLLTKASIVEREVQWPEHMAKVARVIDNRLSDLDAGTNGMLQMDSTIQYGVGKFGGIPNPSAMEDDNPYNTYITAGLPPTPIASPSQGAIEAVLNPEVGDWLYFVTVNLDTGETLFSSTLDQLQEDTKLLSTWCAEEENAGKC